jgi:hypothetical protein
MVEIKTNIKEIVFETEICKNCDELKAEEDFGITEFECSHIFVPENCRKDTRKRLTKEVIEDIQTEIAEIKAKDKNKIVIGFFQTKKNIPKTTDRIEKQILCSCFDGSDGACIYETNIQQEPNTFLNELQEFVKLTGNLDKYLVFEIESNKLREKLELSIKEGLSNFILIAGKYSDNDLWIDLVDRIRAERNGMIAIILPKRMHKTTKKAYAEQAINSGANIVCHGKFSGGGSNEKPRINLFLDSNDMIYKEPAVLPTTSLLKSNNDFSRLLIENKGNLNKEYSLSRVSALRESKLYSDTHKRTIVLNTS